jgi:hypothetical protein
MTKRLDSAWSGGKVEIAGRAGGCATHAATTANNEMDPIRRTAIIRSPLYEKRSAVRIMVSVD